MDQIETSIRKKAFADAGITEQHKQQQSLLKSAAGSSSAAAAASSESADVDVEGLVDRTEEKA